MQNILLKNRQAGIPFIFITLLTDVLSLGIIIPVLPKLVEHFLAGNTVDAAKIYGVFGFSWALMQFLWSPLIGALSDRFGRRPILLMSCFGLGLDYLLMAISPNLMWLFIGRVISGITAASMSTASAYIADVTPPEQRASSYGLIGVAWGVGFVVGPALGGALGEWHTRAPFYFAAALALLNWLYGYFVLPESLPKEKRGPFSWRRANPVGALKLLRSHHELWGLAGINALYWFAHYVLPSTFVLYAGFRFGWGPLKVALMLAAVGVAGIIMQGFLIKPLVKKLGERRALIWGLLGGVVAFAIYGFAPSGAWMWCGIPFGALMGLFQPSLQALMTRHVSAQEQGLLQGANSSVFGIMGMVAPLAFTQTFAFFIAPHAPWFLPGAPMWLAALICVLAASMAYRLLRHPTH